MSKRLAGKHIVIVEDDHNLRSLLEAYFKSTNQITQFVEAETCLANASQLSDADVFLIDFFLPEMNGIDLFRELRQIYPSKKMVLMTGHLSPEMAEEGLALGFDSLILKPFDFNILEKNILELLGESS